MPAADSALQPDQIAKARRLLARPAVKEPLWPALGAAAFAASAAMMLATAMILAPPVTTEHVVSSR